MLQDLVPEKGVAELVNVVPTYYESLAEVLVDARMEGTVSDSNWKSLTNRIIYKFAVIRIRFLSAVERC